MIIRLELPDSLPEGRRSSFKKGIIEILIESATSVTELNYTPEKHEIYRKKGNEVGRELAAKIQSLYPK